MRLLRSFFDTQQLGLQQSLLKRSMHVQRLEGTCVMPPFWPCSTYSRSPVFSSRMPVSPRYEPAANMAERSGLHAMHDMMPAVQGPNRNTHVCSHNRRAALHHLEDACHAVAAYEIAMAPARKCMPRTGFQKLASTWCEPERS